MRRALAIAAVSVACAHVPIAPRSGLVDSNGRPTTLAELVSRQRDVPYVLVGEDHSNACDHDWEERIAEAIAAAGPCIIGLEMVAIDEQSVLDRFNDGSIGVAALDEALEWDKRWGFPFALYRPIFEVARRTSTPVVALNVSKEIEHAVGDGGLEALTPDQRKDVTPRLIPPPLEEEKMLRSAMASHSGHTVNWERFLRVQSLWDSQMAFRAVETHRATQRPVIVFAGGGHVEHGWGIAHRLLELDPGARMFSAIPVRPGDDLDRSAADVFFSCPPAN